MTTHAADAGRPADGAASARTAAPVATPPAGAVPPRAANDARAALARTRVWDLPLRLFHWSLVAAVGTALVTGELGGSLMEVHAAAGITVVGLVAFRLVWGLVGSTHSRFLSFAPTPARLAAYLKGRWQGVGHNPLGALSVFALLGFLAAQAVSGLFGNDDITFTGPLFELVDEEVAARITTLHKQFANLLIGLVALHLAAIVFHRVVKRHDLVKPMVTGWAEVPVAELPPAPKGGGVIAFVVAVAVALGAVWVANGGPWKAAPVAASAPPAAASGWGGASTATEAERPAAATADAPGTPATGTTPGATGKPASPAW
ncbi:cytochrome b/b6 domain-containing protein [Derxia gummosa]|uniref:Cytochrome b/b6 domain-containing protein n=1 Tax=Derxia gummosa DSM 723 TaxID=1121388 RepID=A0A9U5CGB3_9BURK|nr:cytochrome b/b6 domain-containing protein [Derxia gummosa]